MKFNIKLFLLTVASLFASLGCSASETGKHTINADVWADNWFALYVADELIKEDSVAYKTERSFNAESFSFDVELPAQLNVVIQDYIEDDTGLEYIGSSRQQIGDGGFMAQFFDSATGDLLAVSNDEWRCKAIHQAPLNKSCVRSSNPQSDCESIVDRQPDNWMTTDYDDSEWPHAIVHSAQAVRPHGGFSQVSWQPTAELIWTEDLETDNWLLCRFTITAPN
jgi:hypothetical protein